MPSNSIPAIELSADEENRLRDALDGMYQRAKDWKTENWDRLSDLYWQLYMSQPDTATKDYPFPDSSNLFIPLIQVMTEGYVAHEYDAMLANQPVIKAVSLAGHGQSAYEAETLSQFYSEYVATEMIDMPTLGNDLLLDNAVQGTTFAKPRWEKTEVVVRELELKQKPVTRTAQRELFGIPLVGTDTLGVESSYTETARIMPMDKPVVDVGDMGRLLVAPGSGPSLQWPECEYYIQEQHLTWPQLVARRRAGFKNITDDIKQELQAHQPSTREQRIGELEGINANAVVPTAHVLEYYMRWPLPGRFKHIQDDGSEKTLNQDAGEDGYEEEVIVSYMPKGRRLLSIRPLQRVFPSGRRPCEDMRFKRMPRFFYGRGIPSSMRHLNAALNTSWNQMMDGGHLANTPWFFYEPDITGTMPDIIGVRPGQGIPVRNPGGVQMQKFQTDPMFYTSAIQQVQAWAERLGTVNDPMLGRSPNVPNAPRTYRGMAAMMQQSTIAFNQAIAQHALVFVKIFRQIHSLYRRYAPAELPYRILDRQSGQFHPRSIKWEDFNKDIDFQFVLNPNRSAEQQNNLMVFQTLMQVLMQQQNWNGLRIAGKEWYNSMGKKNFDEIWPPPQEPQINSVDAPVAPSATPPPPITAADQGVQFDEGNVEAQAPPVAEEAPVEPAVY